MSLNRIVLAVVVTAPFCLGPAGAQERTIRVGVPSGPLVQLVQVLAPALQAETGIAVAAIEMSATAPLSGSGADAAPG
jgi:tetrahydromethanopterin S-methyltransferase subunit C